MRRKSAFRVGGLVAAGCLAVTVSIALQSASGVTSAQVPPPPVPEAEGGDVETLASGVVHEAFATPLDLNAKPGLVIEKEPPAPIEELPPEQKPVGQNVIWIPGYWAYDDVKQDFYWESGLWRDAPPDRRWVPGHWARVGAGYQWVSGLWAPVQTREIEYQQPPPETLENGPSGIAPSEDQFWVPGCWMWRETRYVWRPGYWYAQQANWIWVPAHYVWTPAGCIFIAGYWDYAMPQRGILYAPVYFRRPVFARVGFAFTPSVFLDVGVLHLALFARPAYCHYYFGDFYANTYVNLGIYPWVTFHGRSGCYDPWWTYDRWYFVRDERDFGWESRMHDQFKFRVDHIEARPPQTFAALQVKLNTPGVSANIVAFAKPVGQLATTKTMPVKLETINMQQREHVKDVSQDWNKLNVARTTLEAQNSPGNGGPKLGGGDGGGKSGKQVATKLNLSDSFDRTVSTGAATKLSGAGGATRTFGDKGVGKGNDNQPPGTPGKGIDAKTFDAGGKDVGQGRGTGKALDDKTGNAAKILDDKTGAIKGKTLDDKSAGPGKVLDDKTGPIKGKSLDDKATGPGKVLDDKTGAIKGKTFDDKSGPPAKVLDDKTGAIKGKAIDDKSGPPAKVLDDKAAGGKGKGVIDKLGGGAKAVDDKAGVKGKALDDKGKTKGDDKSGGESRGRGGEGRFQSTDLLPRNASGNADVAPRLGAIPPSSFNVLQQNGAFGSLRDRRDGPATNAPPALDSTAAAARTKLLSGPPALSPAQKLNGNPVGAVKKTFAAPPPEARSSRNAGNNPPKDDGRSGGPSFRRDD